MAPTIRERLGLFLTVSRILVGKSFSGFEVLFDEIHWISFTDQTRLETAASVTVTGFIVPALLGKCARNCKDSVTHVMCCSG